MACFRETLGGVTLQDKASAAFIAGINPEFELSVANAADREPSFALWTKQHRADHADHVHTTAVGKNANAQLVESPTNKTRHTQQTVCV